MTMHDQRFDRALPSLFVELASASTPDYLEAAIERASSRPQRPAWTYPGRWLPVDITTQAVPAARMPWRQLGILALIGLLLAVAAVAYVGARRDRLACPAFGLAGNGVIALVKDGDIVVADRPGGETRPLVAGPEVDRSPMFSPDGTKLAFLRDTELRIVPDGRRCRRHERRPDPDGTHGRWGGVELRAGWPIAHRSRDDRRRKARRHPPGRPGSGTYRPGHPVADSSMELAMGGSPLPPDEPPGDPRRRAAGSGRSARDRVYDLATGGIRTIVEPAGYVHDVAWSPTGEHISYDLRTRHPPGPRRRRGRVG